MEDGRVQNGRVIIEEFIRFQSEITLLTVRSVDGKSFCASIGHVQESGDYIESYFSEVSPRPHDTGLVVTLITNHNDSATYGGSTILG